MSFTSAGPKYIDYKPIKYPNYSAKLHIYRSKFCEAPSMFDPVEKLASLTCFDTTLGAPTCYGNMSFVSNNVLRHCLMNPQI